MSTKESKEQVSVKGIKPNQPSISITHGWYFTDYQWPLRISDCNGRELRNGDYVTLEATSIMNKVKEDELNAKSKREPSPKDLFTIVRCKAIKTQYKKTNIPKTISGVIKYINARAAFCITTFGIDSQQDGLIIVDLNTYTISQYKIKYSNPELWQ